MAEQNSATLSFPGHGYLWLFIWFLNNIVLTLMNKAFFAYWGAKMLTMPCFQYESGGDLNLFHLHHSISISSHVLEAGFEYPILLSTIHMISSALFATLTLKVAGISRKPISWTQRAQLFLFSLLFSANIVVGNMAIRYTSVSLVQVIRSVIPGVTLVLSTLILKKSFTSQQVWNVLFIVLGVSLATAGEVDFVWIGFFLTSSVCFLSSLKSVLSSKFLVGELSFHEIDLLAHMALYASLQMIVAAHILGEINAVMDWWLRFDSDFGQLRMTLALAANGFLAFLLNISNFVTTKKTSALTVTIAGNAKHIVTILLSVVMFRTPISPLNAFGTILSMIAVMWYSYHDYNSKFQTPNAIENDKGKV